MIVLFSYLNNFDVPKRKYGGQTPEEYEISCAVLKNKGWKLASHSFKVIIDYHWLPH